MPSISELCDEKTHIFSCENKAADQLQDNIHVHVAAEEIRCVFDDI